MAEQAPSKPTLPQNDTPDQQTARANQLSATRNVYVWKDDGSTLPDIPVVETLPDSETPTVEWFLELVGVLIDITKNAVAYELRQIENVVSTLDPVVLEAEQLAIRDAEQYIQVHKVSGIDEALIEAAIADLKDHAENLRQIIERRTARSAAEGANARSLENYRDGFETISVPEIAYTFQNDLEFARLRVAGPNSVLIEAVPGNKIPAKCAISAEQYENIVPNDTLPAALEQGRIFQCDYKDLTSIKAGAWKGKAKYLTCPVALFAVPPQSGSLVPIAINCDPSNPASPVITPSKSPDRQWGWEMAKFCVQAADGNYHELYAHLARTHLVTEAVAIATHRQLAKVHPLWALLVRHFEGTMFINEAAATSLITPGGPIDHIFAGTIQSSQQTAADARLSFDFTAGMLPNDLVARGVDANSPLKDYPYRDDGMLVWNAIEGWVSSYIDVYYSSDTDVTGDTELADWAASIGSSDNGKLAGFTVPTTKDELVKICTMIVFTASAQHAAVNFPQKSIMSFAPAVTGAMWAQAPTTAEAATKQDWLSMMPPETLALEQLSVLFLLGSIYYRPLGTYLSPQFPYPQWFQDPNVTSENGPLARFNAALQGVEQRIAARNVNRVKPYPYLLPSLIPSSTNI